MDELDGLSTWNRWIIHMDHWNGIPTPLSVWGRGLEGLGGRPLPGREDD